MEPGNRTKVFKGKTNEGVAQGLSGTSGSCLVFSMVLACGPCVISITPIYCLREKIIAVTSTLRNVASQQTAVCIQLHRRKFFSQK